jgi:hypothetical protein
MIQTIGKQEFTKPLTIIMNSMNLPIELGSLFFRKRDMSGAHFFVF